MDDMILITGIGSGIGAETARLLEGEAALIGVDRDGDPGRVRAELHRFDVRNREAWHGLAATLRSRSERLRAVVHNAGTAEIAPVPEVQYEDFRRVIETNLDATFLATQALWDRITADGTSVVCVASVAAVVGQDAAAGYVASKGGLVAMVRALAVELAPHGARINAVSPGSTDTPLLRRHFERIPDGETARARLEARQPLGRLMVPGDIAPVVAFLAGPGSIGMNGANVVVDGGLTATFDYGTTFAGGGRR